MEKCSTEGSYAKLRLEMILNLFLLGRKIRSRIGTLIGRFQNAKGRKLADLFTSKLAGQ